MFLERLIPRLLLFVCYKRSLIFVETNVATFKFEDCRIGHCSVKMQDMGSSKAGLSSIRVRTLRFKAERSLRIPWNPSVCMGVCHSLGKGYTPLVALTDWLVTCHACLYDSMIEGHYYSCGNSVKIICFSWTLRVPAWCHAGCL